MTRGGRTILPTRAATLACAALLAACGPQGRLPAGSAVEGLGAVGVATRSNAALQAGAVSAMSAVGSRFGASVPTTITFAFDSDALTPTARAVLDQQADFMLQFPEVRFSVFGHTDLVGSDAYNRALGQRRARAAVGYLAALGVSTARLDALVSLGETQPVVPATGPEPANRRTVTRVSGFVDGAPLVLDGKYAQIVYRRYVAGSGVPATAKSQIGGGGPLGAPAGAGDGGGDAL